MFTDGAFTTRSFAAADDTPSPEGEYGFICCEFKNVNDFVGMMFLDDLRYCPTGQKHSLTVHAADYDGIDPVTTYTRGYWDGDYPDTLTYRDTPFEYMSGGSYYCVWWAYSRYAAPWGGQISADGNEYAMPICVLSYDQVTYLGFSRWFRAPSIAHNYPDTGGGLLYLFVDSIMIVDLLDGLTTPTPV